MQKLTVLDPVSNDGKDAIEFSVPYVVEITIEGTATMLFHRWSDDDVEQKAKAAKGSKAKKTDNLEAYVWRNEKGDLCLPGEYLRMSVVNAAKYRQDPRSPRKSAMDLFKAAIVPLTELASLGTKDWDLVDRRRVVIQRNAITRMRPAMLPGWRAQIQLQCQLPEYIPPQLLHGVLIDAGRLVGVGTFRPTFGRFQVVRFEEL